MYSEFIKNNYNMILKIIDCMKIGVWITDGTGNVVIVNEYSVKRGGLRRDQVIGRNMNELVKMGYIVNEAAALKAIEDRKEVSVIEEMGEGGSLLAVSVPLIYNNDIDLVITIEKNIRDVFSLEKALIEQKKLTNQIKEELEKYKKKENDENDENDIVACSISMMQIKEKAKLIARIDTTVMILGESGTGKELIADMIHKNSSRKDRPFEKINCAAIPETLIESELFGYERGAFTGGDNKGKIGLFERADGGCIFLDEIGELPISMQGKLLRVIQEKKLRKLGGCTEFPVDVRIIAATNRNLREEMEKGQFRSDLYYRLFVVPIEIPPLRKRPEDISILAYYFLRKFNLQFKMDKTISADAIDVMEKYSWPGNVRELKNIIERLVITGAGKEISGFQVDICLEGKEDAELIYVHSDENELSLYEMVNEYEKALIAQALEKNKNAMMAAKALKIDKSTMSKKRRKYNI